MTQSKLLSRILVSGIALLCLGFYATVRAQAPFTITVQELNRAGYHLPSYLPTPEAQVEFQVRLPSHQELTIEWNSLPAHEDRIREEDVASEPLSRDFIVVERKRGVQGGAGKIFRNLNDRSLVVLGVTKDSEIRGLMVLDDPRLSRSEWSDPDGKMHGQNFVEPKVSFYILLPDDPQIVKVVFLKCRFASEERILEEVGSIDLKPKSARVPQVPVFGTWVLGWNLLLRKFIAST